MCQQLTRELTLSRLMMRVQPRSELRNVKDGEDQSGGERTGQRQDSPGATGSVSV